MLSKCQMLPKINKMLPNFRGSISDCPLIIVASMCSILSLESKVICKRNQKLEQRYQKKANV